MIINPKTVEAIERQKRLELRAISDRDALAAADQLLAMAATARYPEGKDLSQGLIQRQKILYRLRE